MKMKIVPNENTFEGLSNGFNPTLLSAAVMEKISKNTTKPPVQCHIENYKNPESFSRIQLSVSFLPQPISTSQETAGKEDIAFLEAMTPCRAVML